MYEMKNGVLASDPRLGRVYEEDLNSLKYLVRQSPIEAPPARRNPRSQKWDIDIWLDQGMEGACVGFGYSHDLAAMPVPVEELTNPYAQKLYYRIQKEDPWMGGAYPGAYPFYEGTSVLTGAKVCKDLGYYTEYRWALDAKDIAEGIAYEGPGIFGLNWYTGMFDVDERGFIHPTGRVEGGHCLIATDIHIKYKRPWMAWIAKHAWFMRHHDLWDYVDMDNSYIVLHNSWGPTWGVNGKAKLTLSELEFLMEQQGEACFPVRNPTVLRPVQVD